MVVGCTLEYLCQTTCYRPAERIQIQKIVTKYKQFEQFSKLIKETNLDFAFVAYKFENDTTYQYYLFGLNWTKGRCCLKKTPFSIIFQLSSGIILFWFP